MMVLALVLFVIALATMGRIGPFVWDGPRAPYGAYPGPAPSAHSPHDVQAAPAESDPAHILARRLADGEISPEEYLERLSLINER